MQPEASGSSPFVPTGEVNPWLSADPWLARSRKLLRCDVSNITNVEETYSQGNRDRDLECVQTLRERRNNHVYLEQKGELAVQGDCAAQRRLSEAEADMDTRNWEQRNSVIAFNDTNRELESQRLELYQASQRPDQAQREKINLCGELEMRNRLFQESRARNCQEIEELRRICCERNRSSQTFEG